MLKKQRRPARAQILVLLPWLSLILGLGMTYALWQNARQDAVRVLEAEFRLWVSKLVDRIEYRLDDYVHILHGVVGLFDASEVVTRHEFHHYVAALRLGERYPGIQGIGFSLFIPPDQKTAHIAAIRQEGFPDYTIHPEGARAFYTSVIYLEPFPGRNQQAFGYDMSSEPVRWAAAMRARDEGKAALSGKVMLQQEITTDIQPGFLLFIPVYYHDDLPDMRRKQLIGWAYSSLRMHDFMDSVLRTFDRDELQSVLNIEIYDGARLSLETQLFALRPVITAATPEPLFRMVRQLVFGGHQWSLRVTSTPQFESRLNSEKAILIAFAGSFCSLLLALFIGVLTSSQRRIAAALRQAERHIADRKRLETALREQAIRDPLTGLFNRRYLDETLPRELHRCRRNGEPLTVAMLDLDYFKNFNDDYGHEAGDTVLQAVGELLRRALRSGDLACRYGGEELVLILPGAPLVMAQARLEELRQAVMQLHPQHRSGELPAITVSIGLAMAKPEEADASALLSRADAALYRAKEQGRNRIMAANGA